MKTAIVSSSSLLRAGRWDPAYHLAIQEAGRRFPSWTDNEARQYLEPLALNMPEFMRKSLAPLETGNHARTPNVAAAIELVQTHPLACLGCLAPHLEKWQAMIAEKQANLAEVSKALTGLREAIQASEATNSTRR